MDCTNEQKLYQAAKDNIGVSLASNPLLGCAEVVNGVHKQAFGDEIGGGTSTYLLWEALKQRTDFEEVPVYEVGAIIISPTGTQPANSRLTHGHVGICGHYEIISNNSLTGKVDTYFTYDKWVEFYQTYGGYPVYFFRKK